MSNHLKSLIKMSHSTAEVAAAPRDLQEQMKVSQVAFGFTIPSVLDYENKSKEEVKVVDTKSF